MSKQYRERIPCDVQTPCKYREEDECFEDIHHEAHPKSAYRTQLEKKFREHAMNKVLTCRAVHDDEHAQRLPPIKPTVIEIKEFLHGNEGSSSRAS